ncbi:MAG TPA: 3-deoxy-D-manno-octulosonic acid kinase [Arenimonas sp.]|uniref:3-deoxy-D-manno-octulosonic acid kinase n=1 Tax=Arenimonas sp. TaxID=1872635 RepID=UPI002D7F0492|nr:3-deoxy-D-manno-octulosonic acid kinase [Arenimonas sp.]HEU0154233.1 3-deoxy-D-manno-octulosonic acid kinase [Arenimonas sp.]
MEVTVAALERQQPFRDARGQGAIVFDPARLQQATPALFDPAAHGGRAQPVQAGGRGAAWFVGGAFGEAVLRHYRRGGLAARLGRDTYLWCGERAVRSFAEFRLLAALHAEGLPVPAPLAAAYWRRGLGYRAALLVERIPGVRALADWCGDQADAAPWEAVGAMLARFHAAGVHHADLNAHNILVDAAGRPWLIDFDRGRRRAPGAWRQANLRRLARSLAKLSAGDARWRPGFARLQAAYARGAA